MVRGPRKHMKRVAAPKHWMLDKLGGCYAPRPSSGPHKLRECLPLALFLRNRLKYALNYTEVKKILAQRLVKVDGRVRTDHTYPSGFMDVIEMEKSGENFRLIYDVKGRYKVRNGDGNVGGSGAQSVLTMLCGQWRACISKCDGAARL